MLLEAKEARAKDRSGGSPVSEEERVGRGTEGSPLAPAREVALQGERDNARRESSEWEENKMHSANLAPVTREGTKLSTVSNR